MALRNVDIEEILDQCRYHDSHIVYSNYPSAYRYIRRQQNRNCREVNNGQPSSIPRRRRDLGYNQFNRNRFRDPLDLSGISNDSTQTGDLFEPFGFDQYGNYNRPFLLLLFIIVLSFIFSKYIYI